MMLTYPHCLAAVTRTFHRQRKDVNRFLQSNDSVSRTDYFRILALASIDILLTLPFGIATIGLLVSEHLSVPSGLPFYRGWTFDHAEWESVGSSYAEIVAGGKSNVAQFYFVSWTSPFLAFVIFGLFGVTAEARASYWRVICTVCGWFGFKPQIRESRPRTPLGDIQFGERPPRDHTSFDLDVECVLSAWNHLSYTDLERL